jgi:hypothetical protein
MLMRQQNIAFLFGAGASKGAGAIDPFPPPLGGCLYDELVEAFHDTWGALEEDERDTFGGDGPGFEAGMQLLWEKFDARASPAIVDMAIYFSRFRPPLDQSDCYSRLMISLNALGLVENVCAATLNYECLLEVAAARAGLAINYGGEGRPGVLGLLKPHGSCNFLIGGGMKFNNVTIVGNESVRISLKERSNQTSISTNSSVALGLNILCLPR